MRLRRVSSLSYSDLLDHIKERQNGIYCLNFLIELTEFEIGYFVSYQK